MMSGRANDRRRSGPGFRPGLPFHDLFAKPLDERRPIAGAFMIALLDLGQNLAAEQIDRGTQQFVRDFSSLREEQYLIHARFLETT